MSELQDIKVGDWLIIVSTIKCSSFIFYRHARWRALVIEVMKIGFLLLATG